MAKANKLKERYRVLRRYMTGIFVTCVLVTVIASASAGASAFEIVKRSLFVWLGFWAASYLIVKTWSSFDDINSSAPARAKKQ